MGSKPYDLKNCVRLGVYTVAAADIIQSSLTMMLDNKVVSDPRAFDEMSGVFGDIGKNAFVIILPDGELALERTVWSNHKSASNDNSIFYLKHVIKTYASFIEAFFAYDVKVLPHYSEDDEYIVTYRTVLNRCMALIKHFNNEPLTTDELKVIGRAYNAFEQVELNKLVEEYYEDPSTKIRNKIRKYMQKIEKNF